MDIILRLCLIVPIQKLVDMGLEDCVGIIIARHFVTFSYDIAYAGYLCICYQEEVQYGSQHQQQQSPKYGTWGDAEGSRRSNGRSRSSWGSGSGSS